MDQIFHIPPAHVSRLWAYIPIGLLLGGLVLVAVLMRGMFIGSRSATFTLTADSLRIRGDVYGRAIPLADIVRPEVGRVDVSTGPYKLAMRTAGTAVPGYNAGWFRLVNGHKALVFITDRDRVVRVPTTAGYDVLLSVAEADDFVRRLRGP